MKFNEFVENLSNYEAGKPIELVVREFGIDKDDVIKLASNENPMGTSKKVQKAIEKNARNAHLYPDDSMFELKGALAKFYNVGEKNIIIGSGSDQIIEFALHAKTGVKTAILTAGVTFAMYGIYASHCEAKVYKTNSQEHNLKELKELYETHKDEIGVIFLCLPNNPLGECLDAKEVYEFIKSIDENVLIVIDGAYNEFAAYKDKNKEIKPEFIVKNFKNVLYLGTFSKLYGLGGMRVGYGIANENIINSLYKLRPPFNVTTLSLVAALAALKDEKFVKETLKNNFKEMKKYEKFADENGIKFINSYTNFITYIFDEMFDSTAISNALLKKGIIVRNLKGYGINGIRITIGLAKQNDKLLKMLEKYL